MRGAWEMRCGEGGLGRKVLGGRCGGEVWVHLLCLFVCTPRGPISRKVAKMLANKGMEGGDVSCEAEACVLGMGAEGGVKREAREKGDARRRTCVTAGTSLSMKASSACPSAELNTAGECVKRWSKPTNPATEGSFRSRSSSAARQL